MPFARVNLRRDFRMHGEHGIDRVVDIQSPGVPPPGALPAPAHIRRHGYYAMLGQCADVRGNRRTIPAVAVHHQQQRLRLAVIAIAIVGVKRAGSVRAAVVVQRFGNKHGNSLPGSAAVPSRIMNYLSIVRARHVASVRCRELSLPYATVLSFANIQLTNQPRDYPRHLSGE